jgi:hypothetical protein
VIGRVARNRRLISRNRLWLYRWGTSIKSDQAFPVDGLRSMTTPRAASCPTAVLQLPGPSAHPQKIRLLDRRAALQEWSTRPTRGDLAVRIVSVGLIGCSTDSLADLDGGLEQKSKRLSDRLKQGSRPKEVLNCNALP